jgi:hypothetical protein
MLVNQFFFLTPKICFSRNFLNIYIYLGDTSLETHISSKLPNYRGAQFESSNCRNIRVFAVRVAQTAELRTKKIRIILRLSHTVVNSQQEACKTGLNPFRNSIKKMQ